MTPWERAALGGILLGCVAASVSGNRIVGALAGFLLFGLAVWYASRRQEDREVPSLSTPGRADYAEAAGCYGSIFGRLARLGRAASENVPDTAGQKALELRVSDRLRALGYRLEDPPAHAEESVSYSALYGRARVCLAFGPLDQPAELEDIQLLYRLFHGRDDNCVPVLVSPKGMSQAAKAWCRVYPLVKVLEERHLRLLESDSLPVGCEHIGALCEMDADLLATVESRTGLS